MKMIAKSISWLLLLLMAFILFGPASCRPRHSARAILHGSWDATWTLDTTGENWPSDMSNTMCGIIHFASDGTAEVHAYGYPGCALATDTLNHRLYWKIVDDMLSFSDDPEITGLLYSISAIKPTEIELQLMEGIRLNLRRL